MGIAHFVLIAVLSFLMAGTLVWLLDRLSNQKTAGFVDTPTGTKAVFLYQAGVLIDANDAGHAMLSGASGNNGEWVHIWDRFAGRFPGFPATQVDVEVTEIHSFPAASADDISFVTLEQWDDLARVTLLEQGDLPQAKNLAATPIHSVMDEAPYPIWQSDTSNQVTWANPAYQRLADDLGLATNSLEIPSIFGLAPPANQTTPSRSAVSNAENNQSYWFDISTTERNGVKTHYAADANAIVNAEIAQRNFVQTLTKTFAQLSIGLAIFDRNRQLALFNPALIDLTSLPADFLSSRPNLQTFFDRMRENRMMPEPRNYASWREHLAEVIVAASDDRYTETWSLPSGVTYRVVGRPHPDGAIAFLFEDISAEVSLTRRFRADLELGLSALDTVSEGVAVFSASGQLGFCNTSFKELWNIEPELGVTEYTVQDALRHWRTTSKKTDAWERLRHHVLDLNPRESWQEDICLESGEVLSLRVVSLSGGFTSVLFARPVSEMREHTAVEMMAS